MRLLNFALSTPIGPVRRLGALLPDDGGGDVVVDLTAATIARLQEQGIEAPAAHRLGDALVPPDMVAFIAGGDMSRAAAEDTLVWAHAAHLVHQVSGLPAGAGIGHSYGLNELELLPAVVGPPVLRDFMAFQEHLENIYPRLGREVPAEWFTMPVYYKANPGSVGAHGTRIQIPDYAERLDFEFEFAAVLGRGGRDIAKEDAASHIFGYTIYNDFSAREMQTREMTVGLGPAKGKDFDGAHVLGPYVVTADEIADVYDLAMTATVNGEVWSTGSTASMTWHFDDMIAHASRSETLRAGEVFGSGTAGNGCGAERGVAFGSGDVIELTVEGLGTLRNEIA